MGVNTLRGNVERERQVKKWDEEKGTQSMELLI